jgi:hypothetical protein
VRPRTVRLIALGALATLARPAHALDPFEIQVYDGTANARGVAAVELHTNWFASGNRTADAPELPLHRQAHATLEPSFGVTDAWELGAYLQSALRADGHFDYAGTKLRTKFVLPHEKHLRLGVNLEVSLLPEAYDRDRWGGEIRPILGYYDDGWLVVANPIVSTPLAFEPALKVTRELQGIVAVGVEYYGSFASSATQHELFEVVDLLAFKSFELNFGVGEGLNAASNRMVLKMILGYAFD